MAAPPPNELPCLQGDNRTSKQKMAALIQYITTKNLTPQGRIPAGVLRNLADHPEVEMLLTKADMIDSGVYFERTLRAEEMRIFTTNIAAFKYEMDHSNLGPAALTARWTAMDQQAKQEVAQARATIRAYCNRIEAGLERGSDNGLNGLGRSGY